MDEITEQCLASWQRHAADFDIRILNSISCKKYCKNLPPCFESLSKTTKSDVVRLSVLYKFGGLWMDASVMLQQSLTWILDFKHFFAFHLDYNEYLESWFLYSPRPNNELCLLWKQKLNDILCKTHDERLDDDAYAVSCTSDDNYFMIYQAFCHLRKISKIVDYTYHLCANYTANDLFYDAWKPIQNHGFLIKFTKSNRTTYKFCRYPLRYIYVILAVIAVILVITAMICIAKRTFKCVRLF